MIELSDEALHAAIAKWRERFPDATDHVVLLQVIKAVVVALEEDGYIVKGFGP